MVRNDFRAAVEQLAPTIAHGVQAMRRLEVRVGEHRSWLMADHYSALWWRDAEAIVASAASVAAWNQKHPDVAITSDQLRASFRQRKPLSTLPVDGAVVAPRVHRRFEAKRAPAQHARQCKAPAPHWTPQRMQTQRGSEASGRPGLLTARSASRTATSRC